MSNVFISHSHRDKEIVRKLAADLQAHGVRTWVDEAEIRIGDSIVERINDALRSADYILVVLSKDSVNSTWVQRELAAAVTRDPSTANRLLIPVVVDSVDVPAAIRHIKYVDLSRPERYEEGLREVVRAVSRTQPKPGPAPRDLIDIADLAREVAKEVAQILNVSPSGLRQHDEEALPEELPEDSHLVFVIIAFAPEMDPIFEGIEAAGKAHGLQVERVKDVQGDYRITDKIIELIGKARFVVADLTLERPNVYFELGYARGLGKTVITTARDGTQLHFDVKDWTCAFYNDSRVLERRLKERFGYELNRRIGSL